MNSVVLSLPKDHRWSPISWAKANGGKKTGVDGWSVFREGSRLFIDSYSIDEFTSEYTDEEQSLVLEICPFDTAFAISYSLSKNLAFELLSSAEKPELLAVDNDHGLICRLSDALAKNDWIH